MVEILAIDSHHKQMLKQVAAPKGHNSGTRGGVSHFYAITSRNEKENTPYVMRDMIEVFSFDGYALLDSE